MSEGRVKKRENIEAKKHDIEGRRKGKQREANTQTENIEGEITPSTNMEMQSMQLMLSSEGNGEKQKRTYKQRESLYA